MIFPSLNHDSHTPRRRSAAYLIEFAIVAPIAFAFIFGLIEIGRAYMVTHQLSNASRRGCRVATLAAKNTNEVNQEVQSALAGQRISGGQTTVYVNNVQADASTATSGDVVTVVVSVPVSSVLWLPGANYVKNNLIARYSLRRE